MDLRSSVANACGQLAHRGPDDSGIWTSPGRDVILGHRRLAIVDLTPSGRQPMTSDSGHLVLVFNGEIYNHLELRARLGQRLWKGHSDTETLLACVAAWGVEATLKAMVGMFALAIWDHERRVLVLARDRFGEKPLYYGFVGQGFAFASELKAIRAFPGFAGVVDRQALASFTVRSYVPEGQCIYEGLSKLTPGSWLELSATQLANKVSPRPSVYWSALDVAHSGVSKPTVFKSDGEAIDNLELELTRSVQGQLMSDVPLGAFLSGGIDSSSVVALMQKVSSRPVNTFSIGFGEAGYDESDYARAIAKHLGTEHTEMRVTSEDALAVIPLLPAMYDEPFADPSQVPTYLVSRMARRHVTVALTGDGGDELFGGYNRHFMVARHWRNIERIPTAVRQVLANGIQSVTPNAWGSIIRALEVGLRRRHPMRLPGERIHKASTILSSRDGREAYGRLTNCWLDPGVVLQDSPAQTEPPWPDMPDLSQQMMVADVMTYLPGDILAKVDRAAMSVSLETRVPMLDHRLYEFAWKLPMEYKIRNGVGKWALRQLLSRHLPVPLFERPKTGFSVPIDLWLRGPLRDWAEDLLEEKRLKQEGFFKPATVRQRWQEHLSGRRNWPQDLWNILMFQAWLK